MRKFLIGLSLLGWTTAVVPSSWTTVVAPPTYAFDSALYTHCVSGWSARSLGEALAGVAMKAGYPPTAAVSERSGDKAYQLGAKYFTEFLVPDDPATVAHVYCGIFVENGPSLFPEW